MGVPAFFRWLTEKYPKVVTDAKESAPTESSGTLLYPNDFSPSEPNPNGFEIDCLYLDMNGIIHPCCHPEEEEAPLTEEEMIRRVFAYVDRIVCLVRPRRLLYLAIDGVAPRAKMNQQRSRRFRAAKETQDKKMLEDKVRGEWESTGKKLPEKKAPMWDSNVITPGTPFMAKLSSALHWYIADRINTRPSWKRMMVIFSDAKVPGEGEHKLMKFVRNQRAQPGYDANTRHCLYGMDADLIMLGLASHEPHFKIVREQVTESVRKRRCDLCGQEGHLMAECTGEAAAPVAQHERNEQGIVGQRKPFQFLHLNVLREYLSHDLYVANLHFPFDLERVIDDFILLAITVGNDFLPHLPSLEIRERALERLVELYRRTLPTMGGYLSDSGEVSMTRLDIFFSALAEIEDKIMKNRRRQAHVQKLRHEERQQRIATERARRAGIVAEAKEKGMVALTAANSKKRKADDAANETGTVPSMNKVQAIVIADGDNATTSADNNVSLPPRKRSKRKDNITTIVLHEEKEENVSSLNEKNMNTISPSKEIIVIDDTSAGDESSALTELFEPVENESSPTALESDSADEVEEESILTSPLKEAVVLTEKVLLTHQPVADIPNEDFASVLNKRLSEIAEPAAEEDQVRFGEDGWKERYYTVKMRVNPLNAADKPLMRKMISSYAKGLAWVMYYYYSGCVDWSWFYPFHYAPFASELTALDEFPMDFERQSKPFTPVAQLMGVLPSASAHAVPQACRALMCEPDSKLADFYPQDFPLDLNGKKYLWQAVALLPWIEEKRLLAEVQRVRPSFDEMEKDRDSEGHDYLFVDKSHTHITNWIVAQHLRFVVPLKPKKKKVNALTHTESKELSVKLSSIEKELKGTKRDGSNIGLFGFISPYLNEMVPGTSIEFPGFDPIVDHSVFSAIYRLAPERPHLSKLLETLVPPEPVLNERDFRERVAPRFGDAPQFMSNNQQQGPTEQNQQWSYAQAHSATLYGNDNGYRQGVHSIHNSNEPRPMIHIQPRSYGSPYHQQQQQPLAYPHMIPSYGSSSYHQQHFPQQQQPSHHFHNYPPQPVSSYYPPPPAPMHFSYPQQQYSQYTSPPYAGLPFSSQQHIQAHTQGYYYPPSSNNYYGEAPPPPPAPFTFSRQTQYLSNNAYSALAYGIQPQQALPSNSNDPSAYKPRPYPANRKK